MKSRKVIITFEFTTDVPASELRTKLFWEAVFHTVEGVKDMAPWSLRLDQVGRPNVIKPIKA